MRKIVLLSTGGTIEKTYNQLEGILHNDYSVLDVILASLRLDHLEILRVPLMNKDSLQMTPDDHQLIAKTVLEQIQGSTELNGLIIVHGTDSLSITGDEIFRLLSASEHSSLKKIPIILTGAMIPYMLRNSDALQNLTEALLAVQFVRPGIYCVLHNQILQFPGVVKDREQGTFRSCFFTPKKSI